MKTIYTVYYKFPYGEWQVYGKSTNLIKVRKACALLEATHGCYTKVEEEEV
jgi:hypothetical protein